MRAHHNHLPGFPTFHVFVSLCFVDPANINGPRFRKFFLSDIVVINLISTPI